MSSTTFAAVAMLGVVLAGGAPAVLAQTPALPPPAQASTPAEGSGFLREPSIIGQGISLAERKIDGSREPDNGLYAELGHMITGAGFISAGPGFRHQLLDGRAVVDMSAAISSNVYKMAQGRFELPHLANDKLAVGGQVIYQDSVRINFFGLGDGSLESDRSGYRLRGTDVQGYAAFKPTRLLSVSGRVGWQSRIEAMGMVGRSVSYPNTLAIFTDITAPGLTQPASFLHGDLSVAADTRDNPGYSRTGGLYSATVAAYSDRDSGTLSFRRYEVEGQQFIPIVADKWTLALRAWGVFSGTSSGNVVPFYLLPSLGGKSTLRGYNDFRFHDRNMQVLNAESRFALFTHVDVAFFADAGKVASRAGDINFKAMKTSYGVGVRLHTRTATLGRMDVGHSAEGWRVAFSFRDAFRHSRLSGGRSPVVPFVP